MPPQQQTIYTNNTYQATQLPSIPNSPNIGQGNIYASALPSVPTSIIYEQPVYNTNTNIPQKVFLNSSIFSRKV
jgi:hypothetical protein